MSAKSQKNAERYFYFRVVAERDLPSGPRQSLAALRAEVPTMACDYCGRVGSLKLQPQIYDNRSDIHYADGSRGDEHVCYKVHLHCTGEHDQPYSQITSADVFCFYLNPRGIVGISTKCNTSHTQVGGRKEL